VCVCDRDVYSILCLMFIIYIHYCYNVIPLTTRRFRAYNNKLRYTHAIILLHTPVRHHGYILMNVITIIIIVL